MTKAADSKKKRKRPQRKPVEMPLRYVIRIEAWDWSYWLGINAGHDKTELYNDFRHLHLTGTVLRPSNTKADRVELIFIPDARYNQDYWHQHKLAHIGTLNLYRGTLSGLFSLPMDVLPSLLTMLAAEKLRFVTISSAKLRYGKAVAQNYSFDMNIDEDDMPPAS